MLLALSLAVVVNNKSKIIVCNQVDDLKALKKFKIFCLL